MSNWTELETASFRGVEFEILNVEDRKGQYLPQFQTPGAYAPSHQFIGHEPRQIEIPAIFRGDKYKEHLEKFLAACDQPESGVLIHPVFGAILVVCKGYRISHSAENIDYAEVTVSFEEHETAPPVFKPASFKLPEPKEAAQQAIADVTDKKNAQNESFLRKLKSALYDALRAVTNAGLFVSTTSADILNQIEGIGNGVADAIDALLDGARSTDPLAVWQHLCGVADNIVNSFLLHNGIGWSEFGLSIQTGEVSERRKPAYCALMLVGGAVFGGMAKVASGLGGMEYPAAKTVYEGTQTLLRDVAKFARMCELVRLEQTLHKYAFYVGQAAEKAKGVAPPYRKVVVTQTAPLVVALLKSAIRVDVKKLDEIVARSQLSFPNMLERGCEIWV